MPAGGALGTERIGGGDGMAGARLIEGAENDGGLKLGTRMAGCGALKLGRGSMGRKRGESTDGDNEGGLMTGAGAD